MRITARQCDKQCDTFETRRVSSVWKHCQVLRTLTRTA